MSADIDLFKDSINTPEWISKNFFYGIVTEEEILECIKEQNLQPKDFNSENEPLYSVYDFAKDFDPCNILHGPVLHVFENLENEEQCLELAQTIVRDAHQGIPTYLQREESTVWFGVDDAWDFKDKEYNKADNSFNRNTQLDISYIKLTAERCLYTALIGYIWSEAPVEEQDGDSLWEFIKYFSDYRKDDKSFKNAIDLIFEELEIQNPEHFVVYQYNEFKYLSSFLDLTNKDYLYDLLEWLCKEYYYPLGFWGVRERTYLRWHRANMEYRNKAKNKDNNNSASKKDDRQWWGDEEMISKGSAYRYGALQGNAGHKEGDFWNQYSESGFDWATAIEKENKIIKINAIKNDKEDNKEGGES